MKIEMLLSEIVNETSDLVLLERFAGTEDTFVEQITSPVKGFREALVFAWTKEAMQMALIKQPGVLIVSKKLATALDKNDLKDIPTCILLTENAELAMAHIATRLNKNSPGWPKERIHPSAVVHHLAHISKTAKIGPFCFIGPNVEIGEGVVVESHVVIEEGVKIGPFSHLMHHCVIKYLTIIGSKVLVKPGAIIGADGFGFTPDGEHNFQLPHLGRVIIHDDVQIGSGNCIDRGKVEDTIIGRGTKFDNLCHVAHNVVIGEHCLFAAGLCAGGSSKIGNRIRAGGQTGVYPHVQIPDDTAFGFRAGVTKTIKEKGIYAGIPAMPLQSFLKSMATLKHLPQIRKDLQAVMKKLGLGSEVLVEKEQEILK